MSAARDALHAHRAELVAQAAVEREELAERLAAWEAPLDLVERGLSIARTVRQYARPLGVAVSLGMTALAFARPNSIAGWVGPARLVWNLVTGRRRRASQTE